MTLEVAHVYVYFCKWIADPHDKIALCFCNEKSWVFFFNSEPCFHGIAQLEVTQNDHPKALTKKCYINLSEVLSVTASEAASASDRDEISTALLDRVIAVLENPIETLPPVHQELALTNFKKEKAVREAP